MLSLILCVPLVGSALIFFLENYLSCRHFVSGGRIDNEVRTFSIQKLSQIPYSLYIALFVSLLEGLLVAALYVRFDFSEHAIQFIEHYPIGSLKEISYLVGVDTKSLYFLILNAILTPIAIITEYQSKQRNPARYCSLFLLIESLLMGVFSFLDLMMFYMAFEAVTIPAFLLIGIYGDSQSAAYKFFLYSLSCSIFMLIGVLYMINVNGSANLLSQSNSFSSSESLYLWLCFFIAFAVKVPLLPIHTWLTSAHVEASTGTSVILSGTILKMGAYGIIRVLLPTFAVESDYLANYVLILTLIGTIYTSVIAIMQEDMKSVIAYSSIGQMGYSVLGIFALQTESLDGALIQMVSHSLTSAALFICIGYIAHRFGTREISSISGIAKTMPRFTFLFTLFTMSAVGLPGTSGFIGKFKILLGLFRGHHSIIGGFMLISTLLSAAYMMVFYVRIIWGKPRTCGGNIRDIGLGEITLLAALAGGILCIGLFPESFLKI